MAYTQTLVAKLALGHLGTRDISNISDIYNADAVALKTRYEHARDMIYVAHDWKWARRSAELQRLPVTPAVRFSYAYALPPNFARIANISRSVDMRIPIDDGDFDISEGRIVTEEEYVFMDYVANDWSEAQWPSYFVEAVALKLAEITCLKITQDSALKQRLAQMFTREILPFARSTDSTAQPFKRKLVRSPWQEARLGRFGSGSNLRRL